MATTYNGQLTANKIMSSIFNMIINQYVEPHVVDGGLYREFKDAAVDEAGLYGDTKLFYFCQALKSYAWDETDTNVLARHLPADPFCQKLVIDTYRQCAITLDSYLSKNAWGDEGSFSKFHSVMLGQLSATKDIEETGIVNVFVGTTSTEANEQMRTIDLDAEPSVGQGLARFIADLEVELKDLNRVNDLGYARACDPSKIRVVINHKYASQIKAVDIPAMYNKEFIETTLAKAKVLPAKYFGTVNTGVKTADANTRAVEEIDIGSNHYYPGDKIAVGESVPAGKSYQEDDEVICKVMMDDSVKMLSAFSVSTSFFNAKNLSENTYLTWGRSKPAYLLDRPFITVKAA